MRLDCLVDRSISFKTVFDFSMADFDGLKDHFSINYDWTLLIHFDINEGWNLMKTEFNNNNNGYF